MKPESINREKQKCYEILNYPDLNIFQRNAVDMYWLSLIQEEFKGGQNAVFQETSRI